MQKQLSKSPSGWNSVRTSLISSPVFRAYDSPSLCNSFSLCFYTHCYIFFLVAAGQKPTLTFFNGFTPLHDENPNSAWHTSPLAPNHYPYQPLSSRNTESYAAPCYTILSKPPRHFPGCVPSLNCPLWTYLTENSYIVSTSQVSVSSSVKSSLTVQGDFFFLLCSHCT